MFKDMDKTLSKNLPSSKQFFKELAVLIIYLALYKSTEKET